MIDKEEKNILIIGGEFNNKGAQAMSFVTIDRLKSEFPNHNILFASEIDIRRSKEEIDSYNFEIIQNPFIRNNFLGENYLRRFLKKNARIDPKKYKALLSNTEFLFDISGYALSSQWGEKQTKKFLKRLDISQKNGTKTFILPQSLGPFDYKEKSIINEIVRILKKVDIIMAREPQGLDELKRIGVEQNVIQSADIVLSNKKDIDWTNIYKKQIKHKRYSIKSNSVVVVPNMRNFDHGNKKIILGLYKEVIDSLVKKQENVYLVRHSTEDLEACVQIKNMFRNSEKVILMSEEMTPFEFEELVQQFDFSIASRFHAIVHSYKAGTPCIILGWAVKYLELAKLFGQEEYVFDVRNDFDKKPFLDKVNKMTKNFKLEKNKVIGNLNRLSKVPDPFDIIFSYIKKDKEGLN